VVTHELSFAERVANRLVFMDEGHIVEEGTPEQVMHAPQNPRTRQFLGQLETDLSDNKIDTDAAGDADSSSKDGRA
jgi:L-cystine transport system ATP-binding protein